MKLRLTFTWAKVLWSWLIVRLGYKYSDKPIPKDTVYCYDSNGVCPYFGRFRHVDYCRHEGFIGLDWCLSDQCKICSIK